MKNNTFLINVFSISFFLSFENEKIEEIKKNYLLSLILKENFINNNDEFFNFLIFKKNEESKKIIINLFKENFEQRWINLFFILIDDKKINLFVPILKKIILFFEKELNIKQGKIFSVIKLSEVVIKTIEKKISIFLKKTVKLTNYLDNNLIGGICVEIENYKWDNSIKMKLEQLKEKLLEN